MVLRAEPTGFFTRDYRFFEADREVGHLSIGPFGWSFRIEIGDERLRIRRRGVRGELVLESEDDRRPSELARAAPARLFSRSLQVRAGDRMLTLAGRPFSLRTLHLRQGDRDVGSARLESWFRRSARFDFPPDLSLEIRIFLAALALDRWRRARAAAAAG